MTSPTWGPDEQELATLRRFADWTGRLTGPAPTPNLNKALAAAQAEFPTFAIEDQREVVVEHKDGGSHSYKYVTLGKVIEGVTPVLAKHGLSFRAVPGYGDPGDGKVGMLLRYTLAHESGEEIVGLFPLKSEGGIQNMGSAITYARRYCLAALLNIAVEQDDDGMAAMLEAGQEPGGVRAASGRKSTRTPPARSNRTAAKAAADALPATAVPQGMLNHMFGLMTAAGAVFADDSAGRDARLEWLGQRVGRKVDSARSLTRDEVQTVIDKCERRIEQLSIAPGDGTADQGGAEPHA